MIMPYRKCTPEVFEEICQRHAKGETLAAICRSEERFPDKTNFHVHCRKNPEMKARFAEASEMFEETLVDECLEIADTIRMGEEITISETGKSVKTSDMLGHRKLQIETRFKLLASKNPARWGTKVDLNHGGQANNPLHLLMEQISGRTILPVSQDDDD